MDGWLENEFLKKTPSSKFGLESQLGSSDFRICQFPKKISSLDFGLELSSRISNLSFGLLRVWGE